MNDVKSPPRTVPEYDTDYYAWTQDQAARLRDLRPNSIDWENVAEEIASLGRSDQRAIASDLRVILQHLIKWRYQPEKQSSSWRRSIDEHRDRVADLIRESPSLRAFPGGELRRQYVRALRDALYETDLPADAVPEACPFTVEQVLDPDFYPDTPAS